MRNKVEISDHDELKPSERKRPGSTAVVIEAAPKKGWLGPGKATRRIKAFPVKQESLSSIPCENQLL